jgi:hypothetical protein
MRPICTRAMRRVLMRGPCHFYFTMFPLETALGYIKRQKTHMQSDGGAMCSLHACRGRVKFVGNSKRLWRHMQTHSRFILFFFRVGTGSFRFRFLENSRFS